MDSQFYGVCTQLAMGLFLRPMHVVINTNSCHLHFSATCKVHLQDALADTPKKCYAAHFWWLVGDTIVVAFGFLTQKFGNLLGPMTILLKNECSLSDGDNHRWCGHSNHTCC